MDCWGLTPITLPCLQLVIMRGSSPLPGLTLQAFTLWAQFSEELSHHPQRLHMQRIISGGHSNLGMLSILCPRSGMTNIL